MRPSLALAAAASLSSADIYLAARKSGKDATPSHVVDVAVYCDSDDAHTTSVSYFAYVRLERR
jgi:hypothetical protein